MKRLGPKNSPVSRLYYYSFPQDSRANDSPLSSSYYSATNDAKSRKSTRWHFSEITFLQDSSANDPPLSRSHTIHGAVIIDAWPQNETQPVGPFSKAF